MVFEVIEYSFNLMKNHPKILLPQVLIWLVTVSATTMIYFAVLDLIPLIPQLTAQDPAVLTQIFSVLGNYLYPLFFVITLAWLVNTYVQVVYPDITKQAFTKKNIQLNQAFSVASSKFLRLLWTQIVLFLLLIGVVSVSVMIFIVLAIVSPIIATIILGLVLFVAIVYVFPGLFLLVPVVVLENRVGLVAIKRSFQIAKGRVLSIWILIVILAIFIGLISLVTNLPGIGIILILPISAITSTWMVLLAPTFYFVVEKKMKPKI